MSLFSRVPKSPARSPPQASPRAQEHSQFSRLEVFASSTPGLPADEAIMKATTAGVVMASNKRLSQALADGDEWKTIPDALSCWTGTMTTYVAPGETFRKSSERIASIDNAHYVVYVDPGTNQRWLFRIPDEHLDKKDAILVVEHPGFLLTSERNDRIVCAAQVDLLERFPASDGWYIGDAKHDIPQGNVVDPSVGDARYLWRIEKNVSLLVRGGYDYGDRRRDVNAIYRASVRLGVVALERSLRFDPNPQGGYRETARLLEPEIEPKQHESESHEPETPNTTEPEKNKGFFAKVADGISGLF